MVDKFVAGCSCQLDRKFSTKPEDKISDPSYPAAITAEVKLI
jgi:hypothetical protein